MRSKNQIEMLRRYIWAELSPWFLLANFLYFLGRFVANDDLVTSGPEILAWLGFAWVAVVQVRTLNDYYEFEQDLENVRKVTAATDPSDTGRIKRNLGITALTTSLLLPLLGFAANLESGLLGLALVFSSWLYSSPQAYFKGRPVLDAAASVSLGIEIMLGGFAVHQTVTQFPGLFLLAVVFILGPMHMVAQITDIVADSEAGLRVTTTLLGARSTLLLSAILFVFAHGLIVGLALSNTHPLDRRILFWSWPSLAAQIAVMIGLFRFDPDRLPAHTWPYVLTIGFVQLPGVVVVLVLRLL